jgi:hypothetical protein
VRAKIEALEAYAGVMRPYPHPRSRKPFEAWPPAAAARLVTVTRKPSKVFPTRLLTAGTGCFPQKVSHKHEKEWIMPKKIAFATCVQLGLSCIEEICRIGGNLDLMISLRDDLGRINPAASTWMRSPRLSRYPC